VFIISVEKTISSLAIEDATEQLSDSKYGLHCLLIYPNIETFREFYICYIQKQINKNNEMVLFNPFYETVSTARQNLSMGHIYIDEFRQESDVSLIIADSLNQYFGKVSMTDFKDNLVKFAINKRKEGVSILSDMGSYFFKMLYAELLRYEYSLPEHFDLPLKGICVYNQLDFDYKLTEKQKRELIEHHSTTIRLKPLS